MALHVIFYALRDESDIRAGGSVSPIARLDVNECMPLNAQLTDVVERFGRNGGWGTPRVMPEPFPRGFEITQISEDDHTCAFGSDHYHDPLTWLPAGEFEKVTLDYVRGGVPIDFTKHHPDAVAALAYIKALPSETPVVLYWT